MYRVFEQKDDRKAYEELQMRLANKLYGTDLDLEVQERPYDEDVSYVRWRHINGTSVFVTK